MRSLGGISIRRKLQAIILLTSSAALLAAGAALLMNDKHMLRARTGEDLTILAKIVASNSTAALALGDAQTATEVLASLRAQPHIVGPASMETTARLLPLIHGPACPSRRLL